MDRLWDSWWLKVDILSGLYSKMYQILLRSVLPSLQALRYSLIRNWLFTKRLPKLSQFFLANVVYWDCLGIALLVFWYSHKQENLTVMSYEHQDHMSVLYLNDILTAFGTIISPLLFHKDLNYPKCFHLQFCSFLNLWINRDQSLQQKCY